MYVVVQVFELMCASVAVDGVTCCSLINAMDKAGEWQLAEAVFRNMCTSATLTPLLSGIEPDYSEMPERALALLRRLNECLAPSPACTAGGGGGAAGSKGGVMGVSGRAAAAAAGDEQELLMQSADSDSVAARFAAVQLTPTQARPLHCVRVSALLITRRFCLYLPL